MDNGKFADFKGTREVKKVKPEAQKIAERKDAEAIGDKHGFDVSNPEVEGTISKEDIELLRSGEMSLAAVISLANNRKIEIPSTMEDKGDIINLLLDTVEESAQPSSELVSKDDAHAIGKMSIPEMRAYAKEKGIKIPGTKKKAADIKDFLINGEQAEDAL